MIIILLNISASTENQDIEDFIRPAIKGGLLRKSGHIEKISILALKDTRTYRIDYHGLITITPDPVAIRAIKKLNKKLINGRRVLVREFRIRLWHNDPRINRRDQIQEFNNRRQGDRRLRHVEIKLKYEKDLSGLFSSEERFSNKLGDDAF
jgi:hypothetical protein